MVTVVVVVVVTVPFSNDVPQFSFFGFAFFGLPVLPTEQVVLAVVVVDGQPLEEREQRENRERTENREQPRDISIVICTKYA